MVVDELPHPFATSSTFAVLYRQPFQLTHETRNAVSGRSQVSHFPPDPAGNLDLWGLASFPGMHVEGGYLGTRLGAR